MEFLPTLTKRISERVKQGITIAVVCLVLTFLGLLGFAAHKLAGMQKQLVPLVSRELSRTLGREVRVGSVQIRGWDSLLITNAAVAKGKSFDSGTALSASQVTARLNLLAFALHRNQNPVGSIRQIVFQQPVVEVERSAQGRWDFQDILDRMHSTKTAGVMRAQLIVNGGKINYRDAKGFSGSEAIRQELVGVSARVTPTGKDSYRFEVAAKDAAQRLGQMKLAGDYSRHTGAAGINLSADKVVVKELARYLPKPLPITFEDGTAAFRLSALFRTLPSPNAPRPLPTTALTAEVDLSGVGLRLREMSAPVMADSGRLRLVHDSTRYPRGSRLEFVNVRAHAGELPIELSGTIGDLNLFDLAHLSPDFHVQFHAATEDGAAIARLFPGTKWLSALNLQGPIAMQLTARGRPADLQIDGTFRGERFQVSTFRGEGITSEFTLRPGTGGKDNRPTLLATAHLRHAEGNGGEVADIRLSASSVTPWQQLDTALRVNGDASAKRVRLPWGDVTDIRSAFTTTRTHATLQGVQARLYGGQASGDISFPIFSRKPAEPTLTAAATYQGINLNSIAQALRIPNLSGSSDGNVDITVHPDNGINVRGTVTGTDMRYREYKAPSVSLSLQAQNNDGVTNVTIPSAEATTDYGTFHVTDGSYQLHGTNPADGTFTLPLQAERVPLQQFAAQFSGLADLQGTFTGNSTFPEFTARGTSENMTVLGHAFQHASGEMRMRGKELRFSNLQLTRPGMSVTVPGGEEGFDPRQGFMEIPVTVSLDGAPLAELLNLVGQQIPWAIDGRTYGKIDFRMTNNGAVASGSAEIPKPVVHIPTGQRSYPLSLSRLALQFDLNDRTMQLRQLTVQRGKTTALATGTAVAPVNGPLQADLTFRGDGTLLEDLPQDLLGFPAALSGSADIRGTLAGVLNGTGPEPMRVNVTASTPQLVIEGVPAGNGNIELDYSYRPQDRRLLINRAEINNTAFRMTSRGDYLLSDRLLRDVRLSLDRLDLAALRELANSSQDGKFSTFRDMLRSIPTGLAGQGNTEILLTGNLQRPEVTLNLNMSQLHFNNTPLPDLRAQLASEFIGDQYALRIKEAAAVGGAGEGRAGFSGLIAPGGNLDLRYAAQDITAKLFSPWVGTLPIDGRASMEGTVRGPWQSPVVEGNLQVDRPVIANRTYQQLQARMSLTRDLLTIRDGQFLLASDTLPLSFQGTIPWQWDGSQAVYPAHHPVAISATLPKQSLSLLRAFVPRMPEAQGTIEGNLNIGGTITAPRVTDGRFQVAGSAALPAMDGAYPNRVNDIDLRLSLTSEGKQSRLRIDRLTAVLDRQEKGTRPKDFQPGWIAAEGSLGIGSRDLLTPDRWQWDVYGKVVRLPVPAELCLVPQITGFLHLQTGTDGKPLVTGVMLTEHVKIKEPKTTPSAGGTATALARFPFNPRLSMVVQVGEGVRIAKSIVRLPLKPTPLPWPETTQLAPGTQPSLEIDRESPSYDYNASMLNPNSPQELPGTWATINGTLADPRLYARFEVNKSKLSFPFSLFSSIRKARGHVTYSLADGPRITMGIPDFPTTQAAQDKGKETGKSTSSATREASPSPRPAAVPVPALL